jgi:hypothetical protein
MPVGSTDIGKIIENNDTYLMKSFEGVAERWVG